ncbi:hypothetical protein SAZ11_49730 [Streptomyces sp. FXJ1.4098]|nr:hypothetical protein [Streptomyces sp. FXJ1.4098]
MILAIVSIVSDKVCLLVGLWLRLRSHSSQHPAVPATRRGSHCPTRGRTIQKWPGTQIVSKSAELFGVIAAIIRRHTRDGRTIPLLPRYDPHERRSSAPMPFLFQRRIGTNHESSPTLTVVNMLKKVSEFTNADVLISMNRRLIGR